MTYQLDSLFRKFNDFLVRMGIFGVLITLLCYISFIVGLVFVNKKLFTVYKYASVCIFLDLITIQLNENIGKCNKEVVMMLLFL